MTLTQTVQHVILTKTVLLHSTLPVTQSGKSGTEQLVAATMTIIETGDNTGVFVGTFKVPDYKGSDMELVYYDAKGCRLEVLSNIMTQQQLSQTTGSM